MPSDTYTLTIADAANAIPASGSVNNASVAADAAIAFSKLAALSSGNILVGSSGGVPTSVNPSGDVDISNTGVFSIASEVIVNADISPTAAIVLSKLAAGTVAGQIPVVGASPYTPAYQAISGDATLNGSGVLTVSANAIDSAKLKSDSAIDSNRAVTTDHIRNNSVTLSKLEAPVVSGIDAGGVLIGATVGTSQYSRISVASILLNSSGTGFLQQLTKDGAASTILPDFASNENRVLGLSGTGALQWQDPLLGSVDLNLATTKGGTGLISYVTGDVLYASAANVLSKRPIGLTGRVFVSNGTTPEWNSIDLSAANAVGTSVLGETNGGTGTDDLTDWDVSIGLTGSNTIETVNGNIETTGSGNIETTGSGSILVSGTGGLGYGSGSGGGVEQLTDRTTTVELNETSGAIKLVSDLGVATWTTFTVENDLVEDTDVVIVNQQSGTDPYAIHVTRVVSQEFDITFSNLSGSPTTEQPVFNFAVIKAGAVTP
jgi:hypothetical protein